MIQYLSMLPTVIHNSAGEIRKVIDFRKRIRYDLQNVLIATIQDNEYLRLDVLADRLYQNLYQVGPVIDVNDTDFFSFSATNTIQYANPGIV